MKRLLISGAAVAAVLALAACGGGNAGGGGGSSPGTMGSASNAPTVSSKDISNAGSVLVDSSGQALYASDQETGGKVLCTDACLSFWTPLTIKAGAPSGSSLPGKLGVVKRPDGTRQVTYNGKLLYSFTQDQPGEVSGDGFKDAFGGQQFTWHVVHTSGGSSSSGSGGGGGTSPSPYSY